MAKFDTAKCAKVRALIDGGKTVGERNAAHQRAMADHLIASSVEGVEIEEWSN